MNFYFEAAKTLDRLDAKQGSIKGVLATLPEKDRKRTAALVIETLKYKAVLTSIIEQAKLLQEERKKIASLNLALVLVHDLVLNKGIQAGDGPIKQAVLRHKTRLNSELQKIKIKRGVKSNVELALGGDDRAALIPRYVRVNTILWTTGEAVKYFTAHGFTESGPFESSKGFCQDSHIPNLLLFDPQAQLMGGDVYTSGKIILQDKASCFPAVVLSPPARDDTVVIDATAAPGNKTSHLCALMKNKGKLYAFERDKQRFGTLKKMLSKARCENVEPVNDDFLAIDPAAGKFAEVTHILLDPSCSGSGIVNRLDHLLNNDEDESEALQDDRLSKLAAFQLSMIRHAMKFPNVRRIVYSTCSVHAVENEHVVRDALKTDEARQGGFIMAHRDEVLPTWHRRGLPEAMDDPCDAQSVVRCSPGEDATNGFFVSCSVRAAAVEGRGKRPATPSRSDDERSQKKRPSKRRRKAT